ncbi:MAG: hypothetical protein HY881_17720 [Deltaproteobacteria bacterium]|nr:hypothetical protein [Deltaproteobacteria bacterium]
MKKTRFFLLFMGICLAYGICLADTPNQVGGFQLGADISTYKDRVDMTTALTIRYAESITEVAINKTDLLASGLIAYGTCATPGKVVRIKLKYADSSKEFYDMLLTRFEKKFGKPAEWRGDPFHIVIAWKWSFVDKSKNRISLILQHNKQDTDEKIGNSIKLTMIDAVDKERQCYDKSHPEVRESLSGNSPVTVDWDILVPR